MTALALAPMQAQAQTVTFAGTTTAAASGSGAFGTPTLMFNVAAGQNRVVLLSASFERDHCISGGSETVANCIDEPATQANSNFAGPTMVANNGTNVQIQFTASGPGGSMTLSSPLAPPAGDLRFANRWLGQTGTTTIDRTIYSQESYFLALYEADLRTLLGGTGGGTITITLPNVQAPHRAGDEAMLTGLQFNNVSQRKDGTAGTGIVRSGADTSDVNCATGASTTLATTPGTWSKCLTGYDAGQAPVAAGDGVLLFGFNGYAGTGAMGFDTVAGYTEVANPSVSNTDPITDAGTATGANFITNTESDGFSTSFQFRNGVPSPNVVLQSRNGSAALTSGGQVAKFTLTRAGMDLTITKTDGVTSVAPGGTTTYTIVVTNPSVNFADGAVVTDPVVPGLNVTNVTCAVTTGAAVCPASLTQADPALRVAALQSGATIARFAPSSSLTLTVTATVGTGIASVSNTATLAAPPGYTDLVPATNTVTDTDTVLGTIVIIKDALPDHPQDFGFTTTGGSGLAANFDLDDDPTDATLPNSRTFYVTPGATVYTVKEATLPSGWTQSNVSCTTGGTVSSGTASITVAAGETVTCTFTNAKTPTVKVQKITQGGAGGAFNFTQTNLASAPPGITTGTAGTPAPASPTAINVIATGTAVTLTEGPLTGTLTGWALVSASCTDANSAVTGNAGTIGALVGSTLTIPAANVKAGADFTCVFTNARPRIRLNKLLPDGRMNDGLLTPDQFSLSIVGPSGGLASASSVLLTTTGNGTTANGLADTNTLWPANSGGTYALSETRGNLTTDMTQYVSSLSCVNAATGSTTVLPGGPGATGFSVTPTGNDDITCTFTNRKKLPQLTTTKTASANPLLVGASGQSYTITITVANGPTTAPITLTDALPAGITTSGPVTAAGGTLSGCPAAGATNLTGCSIATGVASGSIVITVPVAVAVGAVGPSGATNTVNVAGGGDPLCTVATGQPCDASTTTTAVVQPATLQLAKAWGAGGVSGNVASIGASTGGASNTTAFTATAPTAGNSGAAVMVVAGNIITLPAETMTTGTLTNYNTVLSCTANGGATANALSSTNGQTTNTLLIGASDAGKAIVCTYTNTGKPATLTLAKRSLGGVAGFDFTGTNGVAAHTITTTVAGTAVNGPLQTLTATGTATTFTETYTPATGVPDYVITDVSCTGMGSGGTVTRGTAQNTNQFTLNAAATVAGSNIVCTVTNAKAPTVQLRKKWVNALVNDAFTLTASGTVHPNHNIGYAFNLQATANTPNETDTGGAQRVAVGDTVTLSETPFGTNAGSYTASAWSCTGGGSLSGNLLTLGNADAGLPIICEITNTAKTATVTLAKTWSGASVNDAVSVTGTGLTTLASVANTAAETDTGAAQAVPVGSVITLAESFTTGSAANYTSALSCTGTSGLSGNTLTVGAADTAIVCTYTNTKKTATLKLAKAWGPNSIAGNVASIGASTGGASNTPAFAATAPSPGSSGAGVSVAVGNIITLPAETMSTGTLTHYTTTLSCTADGGTTANALSGTDGQLTNTLTIGAADEGKAIVCTYTNTRRSGFLRLAKQWAGAAPGDDATLNVSRGGTIFHTLDSDAASPSDFDSDSVTTQVQVFAGETLTLAETLPAANVGGYTGVLTSCSPWTVSGATVTVGNLSYPVSCVYTNTRMTFPVKVTKTWTNANAGDRVNLSISGLAADVTAISAGSSTAPATTIDATAIAATGSAVTVAEAFTSGNEANYSTTLSCTNDLDGSAVSLTTGSGLSRGFVMPKDSAVTCTFVNTRKTATLQLAKVWGAGSTAGNVADIGASAGGASNTAPFTANAPAAGNSGAGVTVAAGDILTLPAETMSMGTLANYSTVLSCTANGGATANALSGTNGQAINTLLIGVADAGKAIVCTYTNTPKMASLQLAKAWGVGSIAGNVASIGASAGGTNNTTTFAATAPAAGNSGAAVAIAVGDLLTFPGETMTTGALTNYTTMLSCTANGGTTANTLSGTNGQSTNTLLIGAADAGKAIVCTYTNTRLPTVQISKQAMGGTGTFTFSGDNGFGTDSIQVTTAGATVAGAVRTLTVANTQTVLTEPAGSTPAGFIFAGATCSGLTGGATAVVDTTARTVTLPAAGLAEGAAVACTFTNAAAASVSGRVFLDIGSGATATANDGVLNGAEAGIPGVSVKLTNCAATIYGSTITDGSGAYTLAIPASVTLGGPICVEEFNTSNRISTGASVGNMPLPSGAAIAAAGTTYTYTRAGTPDRIAFTWNGAAHANLNFGDVDPSTFATSGAKTGQPDNTVTYAHTFVAGTGGSVAFAISASTSTPTLTGWAEKIFADPTCSGSLQPGAATLYPPSTSITVSAGQSVCVIVQEFIPATAQPGHSNDAKVQANFTLTNSLPAPALSASYTLDDITTVSTSALELKKEVRNVTQGTTAFTINNQAKSGETLEYRVTYTNNGTTPIGNLTVNDATPAYTTFVSSTAGTTPATLTACRKATPANPAPAATVACGVAQVAGGSGPVSWIFSGTLNPGATGTVLFQVKVD
ncbi:putative repeat protein (TIGR01451 family) [Variovorax boronicumulans]|uniref:Repeat protein (TIGR01451 family) n=1 Tax=Variovorax boronicumulans TaxID=436515 RepID=A0AAW8DU36_9BURK|nr:hypothetical protein [Variovorax boronicumulans]MDP9877688.1 putative repeat protein (TIGR01451 family) [Variovorax boronicumulans]MDP9922972.1 putative repeat protein (TIGR01451 family) [Variovorax boronicumulans]